ncbi:MAG: hypothetical protein OXI09_14365 [Chloroflexota bacterium]|nr:hypothetical protein [Chloroflexota bacterium]
MVDDGRVEDAAVEGEVRDDAAAFWIAVGGLGGGLLCFLLFFGGRGCSCCWATCATLSSSSSSSSSPPQTTRASPAAPTPARAEARKSDRRDILLRRMRCQ